MESHGYVQWFVWYYPSGGHYQSWLSSKVDLVIIHLQLSGRKIKQGRQLTNFSFLFNYLIISTVRCSEIIFDNGRCVFSSALVSLYVSY